MQLTLTIRFGGNFTGNLHLLWRFGTKSGGTVKLRYVYKVKQRNSAVYYGYSYDAIGCNFSLMCLQHGMVWFSMRYVTCKV